MTGVLAQARPTRGPLARTAIATAVGAAWAVSVLPSALLRPRCIAAAALHHPCPGCGMTRAGLLLLSGDVAGSLRMHPLLVPAALATGLLAFATVRVAFREGSLMGLWRDRLGRVALGAFVLVYVGLVALWLARFAGCFGGPVPV